MIPDAVTSTETSLARRALAFAELAKPELTGLSALTAVVACILAGGQGGGLRIALEVGVGTLLVGASAGTMNQLLERHLDALMKRTEKRPLPSGRVNAFHALVSGLILGIGGLLSLYAWFGWTPCILAFLTLLVYLGPYTSLKRLSWINTLVGAIPGALPVLIGWTAANSTVNLGGWVLFAVVYLWQLPHFLSLAWMYRRDYSRASFRMLSTIKTSKGLSTGVVSVLSSLCLTLLLVYFGYAILGSTLATVFLSLLGVSFLVTCCVFLVMARRGDVQGTNQWARVVFFWSLGYLPVFMIVALWSRA